MNSSLIGTAVLEQHTSIHVSSLHFSKMVGTNTTVATFPGDLGKGREDMLMLTMSVTYKLSGWLIPNKLESHTTCSKTENKYTNMFKGADIFNSNHICYIYNVKCLHYNSHSKSNF